MNCYISPIEYQILRNIIKEVKARILILSRNPRVKHSNIKHWVDEAKRIIEELEEDLEALKKNDTICYNEFYSKLIHVDKILDRVENTIKPIQLD